MALVPSLAHGEAVHACHGRGYEISDRVASVGHYSSTNRFSPPLLVVVHHMLDEISEMVVI